MPDDISQLRKLRDCWQFLGFPGGRKVDVLFLCSNLKVTGALNLRVFGPSQQSTVSHSAISPGWPGEDFCWTAWKPEWVRLKDPAKHQLGFILGSDWLCCLLEVWHEEVILPFKFHCPQMKSGVDNSCLPTYSKSPPYKLSSCKLSKMWRGVRMSDHASQFRCPVYIVTCASCTRGCAFVCFAVQNCMEYSSMIFLF